MRFFEEERVWADEILGILCYLHFYTLVKDIFYNVELVGFVHF